MEELNGPNIGTLWFETTEIVPKHLKLLECACEKRQHSIKHVQTMPLPFTDSRRLFARRTYTRTNTDTHTNYTHSECIFYPFANLNSGENSLEAIECQPFVGVNMHLNKCAVKQ